MSGHSKWSKIKRKKGVNDQKKGKIFTRCGHEIAIAVREGGGPDPSGNARLQLAIEKAKAVNMPNDNIDRAIKRATGDAKGSEQHEITYEGYGPCGVAIMIEALTDNKNRTVSDLRHAFSRNGCALGDSGSVAWLFERKGQVTINRESIEEEQLMEIALDAGAEDISDEGDVWELTCDTTDLHNLSTALTQHVKVEEAELQYLPKTKQAVEPKEAEKVMKFLELLEDLDDVMNVSANLDFVDTEES